MERVATVPAIGPGQPDEAVDEDSPHADLGGLRKKWAVGSLQFCWKSCRVVNTIRSRPSRSRARKSRPNSAASRMSLFGATSKRTIMPGSLNRLAPRYTNSAPSVVFPVPAVPATRVMGPRGMPEENFVEPLDSCRDQI
jgi:hypothetical protein